MSRPRSPRTCAHPDAPGPTRKGDCSACYQTKRRGPSSRQSPPLVLLPGPRVPASVASRLRHVAFRLGVQRSQLHREILERWAAKQS